MTLFCLSCTAKLDAGARPADIKGCKVCGVPPQSLEYRRKHKGAYYVCAGCEEPFMDISSKAEHMTKCEKLKKLRGPLDQVHVVEAVVGC